MKYIYNLAHSQSLAFSPGFPLLLLLLTLRLKLVFSATLIAGELNPFLSEMFVSLRSVHSGFIRHQHPVCVASLDSAPHESVSWPKITLDGSPTTP